MTQKISFNEQVNSDGWVTASVQPTRTSADDPTYTIQFSGADFNPLLKEGTPVKWTQNSIVRYGWISSDASYSGGNTSATVLTICSGTSANYDVLDTSTYPITEFSYGLLKQPGLGFPISEIVWSVFYTDTSQRTQGNPTQYNWYNINSAQISVPIGTWKLRYEVEVGVTLNSTPQAGGFAATLSSDNGGITSDPDFTEVWLFTNVSGNYTYRKRFGRSSLTTRATKITYYLKSTCNFAAPVTSLDNWGNSMTTKIEAVCAYL